MSKHIVHSEVLFIDGTTDVIINVTRQHKRWFGGVVETIRSYRGGCSVWYTWPECKRCDLITGKELSDIWQKAVYERKSRLKNGSWKIGDEIALSNQR